MSSYPTRMKERKNKAASLLKENKNLAVEGLAIKPNDCKVSKQKVQSQPKPRIK